jgi:hypothetical protein
VTRTQQQIDAHRQGEACIEVRDAAGRPRRGVPVWVEQETHSFPFGCVLSHIPDTIAESDRQRFRERMTEVFNRLLPAGQNAVSGSASVEISGSVRLRDLGFELDRLAAMGRRVEILLRGWSVGLHAGSTDAEEAAVAERVAELYTFCFAHLTVNSIVWDGIWDGETSAQGGGLLRADFAPKRAYRYLHKLIGTVWHSRAAGQTDAGGCFRFRGFFGDYRLAARAGESPSIVALLKFSDPSAAKMQLTLPTALFT